MPSTVQSAVQSLPLWVHLALALVPAVSAVFAAVGLLLTVRQSQRTNAQARAALVSKCLADFADDEDMQKAFYAIEYSEFKYGHSFHKSEQEREVDKLLRHFANLALAWQARLLSTQDIRPVQYYVLRVLRDPEIQKYLAFVEQWSSKARLGEHPYAVLAQLAARLESRLTPPSSEQR